jgi:ADP-heptose:LPS heptosyltransferase
MKKFMLKEALFLPGSLDVGQLAALLKKSKLFISNDSGPVHVAVAVKTPVVDIFGRSQSGLSPTRWGPTGPQDIVVHKDTGCKDLCLAHDCKKGFECLVAISVEEVLSAIKGMGILD